MGQGNETPYTLNEIARRMCWGVVQSTLFRWSPRALHGFRAALLRLFGAQIARKGHVRIFPTVTVVFPWKLNLEARSMVGPRVRIYNLAPVSIRRGANVSQDCHICAGSHDYSRWSMPLIAKPIVIGENVWVAAEVFVGPGVSIGELCVVGARSVVVKDLPPRTLCAGNPCRVIRDRSVPTQ